MYTLDRSSLSLSRVGHNPSNNQNMGEINHYQQQQIYDEEPLADHYVEETMHAHLGVIVHCEPEYSAVWSPDFQLVRIQLPTLQDPANQPVWPCCCWVNFRCIEEVSPLRGDVRCNYLAYDVKKVPSGPVPVKQLGDCIAAPMRLKRAEAHSKQFFLAYDDFFGPVLCCARDKNIIDRMNNPEAEIEVYSIYTDTYQFSKWMAVLYKERSSSDGRWNKLEGLPPAIDSLVDTFFPEYRCSIPSTPFQNFRIQQQQNFSNINQQQLDQQPSTSQQAAQRSSHNLLVGINKQLSLQQPKAPHSAGGDIIGGQHIPTASSMRSSFSTATNNEMMARALFPISSEDDNDDVMSNLDRYIPGKVDKRFNGIVVRKRPQYAIVYTQPYGDALVLPCYVKEGQQHFDRTFVLGRTIAMGFAPVKNQEGLKFKWMGLPKFKVPSKQIEPVRLVHGQFLQIHAICKFYERDIKLCTADEGMKPNDEMAHCHYNIEEEVGKVLVDPSVLQKNRLVGKKAKIWITHISESCYGCNWMMAIPDPETGLLDDVVIIDDVSPPMPQQQTTGSTTGTMGQPPRAQQQQQRQQKDNSIGLGHPSTVTSSPMQMQRNARGGLVFNRGGEPVQAEGGFPTAAAGGRSHHFETTQEEEEEGQQQQQQDTDDSSDDDDDYGGGRRRRPPFFCNPTTKKKDCWNLLLELSSSEERTIAIPFSIEPSHSAVRHAPDDFFNFLDGDRDGAGSDFNIRGTSTPPPPQQPPPMQPSMQQQPSLHQQQPPSSSSISSSGGGQPFCPGQ